MSVLLDGVAAYRLTKLVTDDSITQPIRDRIIEAAYVSVGRAEEVKHHCQDRWGVTDGEWIEGDWQRAVNEDDGVPPKLAVLVTCRWCAGMWVALGVVYVARRGRWWRPMSEALALSSAAALLARLED